MRQLSRLPYDIQEDITEYLSSNDLCALSLASKYLSSLAARALYAHVALHSALRPRKPSLSPLLTLRARQYSFLIAITHHPEYTRFVRSIAFEFTDSNLYERVFDRRVPHDLVWRVFSRCIGVTAIHLKMPPILSATSPHPNIPPLFPNLRSAILEGPFTASTLERLIHPGGHLRSLDLRSLFQVSPSSSTSSSSSSSSSSSPLLLSSSLSSASGLSLPPIKQSLHSPIPELELTNFCLRHPNGSLGLASLKTLCLTVTDTGCTPMIAHFTCVSLRCLFDLISPNLESLMFNVRGSWDLQAMMGEHQWPVLAQLDLKVAGDLFESTVDSMAAGRLRGACPALREIRVSNEKDGSSTRLSI